MKKGLYFSLFLSTLIVAVYVASNKQDLVKTYKNIIEGDGFITHIVELEPASKSDKNRAH